jgi:hypothetical protein
MLTTHWFSWWNDYENQQCKEPNKPKIDPSAVAYVFNEIEMKSDSLRKSEYSKQKETLFSVCLFA